MGEDGLAPPAGGVSNDGDDFGRGPTGGARSTSRSWPRVAAGAFIIGLAVVLAVLTSGAGGVDDDDEDEDEAATEEADQATDGTTTTAAPTTTTTPTTTVPPWQPVQAGDGAFSLELPATWAFASLAGDPAAIARQLYTSRATPPPLEPSIQLVTNNQCPECHSIAIDPTRENFAGMPTNVTVRIIPGVGGVGLAEAIDGLRTVPDPQGMVAGGDGLLTSPAGEIGWLDFTIPGVDVTGRHYFLAVGADLWRLTYLNPWNDPDRTVPDRIATSLTPATVGG
jgi:hypothetical protein